MTDRRTFLAQASAIATAAMTLDAAELEAAAASTSPASAADWDTSWIARVASARFRAVFNASEISDGAAMNYAASFLDDFHALHRTTDAQTRPVIVFRRLGTPMAFGDALWERHALGAELKIMDPATHAPATRNVFWRAPDGASAGTVATTLETLGRRGTISLVCNVSLGNWARRMAEREHLDADAVAAEARAQLIPGAIVVPSGIYALIRAQNAGCAYMQGT
jgi:intracellular sulfur oxidation DsrE/DsrF family protein